MLISLLFVRFSGTLRAESPSIFLDKSGGGETLRAASRFSDLLPQSFSLDPLSFSVSSTKICGGKDSFTRERDPTRDHALHNVSKRREYFVYSYMTHLPLVANFLSTADAGL